MEVVTNKIMSRLPHSQINPYTKKLLSANSSIINLPLLKKSGKLFNLRIWKTKGLGIPSR
jgi:hypothetical protein